MGSSNVNGHELSDDGLDISTHWIQENASQWKKTAQPTPADWLRLLDGLVPDQQSKGRARLKQLSSPAQLVAPAEVVTNTKQFIEKLNRSFNADFQRAASAAEIFLHALIAMSSEDVFNAAEKQALTEIIQLFKDEKGDSTPAN